MLDIEQAEDLFGKLAESPHQTFEIESQCSIRARLMVTDAFLDHDISASDMAYIYLHTPNSRFNRRPLPREVFDFAFLCAARKRKAFDCGDFRFSLISPSHLNASPQVRIERKDRSQLSSGEWHHCLNTFNGVPDYDQHWAVVLNTSKGKKVCDRHISDALIGVEQWIEACGASHGITVQAGLGEKFPKPYADYSPLVPPDRGWMEMERKACISILRPFRAYQKWRRENWKDGINPALANKILPLGPDP